MDEEITAEELKRLLDEDADVRIVDIRDPQSFVRGHIPKSENIPFAQIPNRVEELAGADRVVAVCPIGQSSLQAARLIRSYEGVEGPVESLADGIDGWEYDLVVGNSAETTPEGATADEGPEAPF